MLQQGGGPSIEPYQIDGPGLPGVGGKAFECSEKMIQVKARADISRNDGGMWNPIASAPFGRNLELAVIDEDGLHALVFPCRKAQEGWRDAVTGVRVDIRPTHWRDWETENRQAGSLPAPT